MQDLGYFNLERMKQQAARGEYWISRYQINTALFDKQGLPLDLSSLLYSLKQAGVTQPEEAAARSRAKMKENASKQGRTATQARIRAKIIRIPGGNYWMAFMFFLKLMPMGLGYR